MSTPGQIADGASSLVGLDNKLAAIIYLLNTSNMTAAQIATGASQFVGLPNKEAAIIYLLSAIAASGGSGTAGVTVGNYGGGEPTFTPLTDGAVAIDSSNSRVWWWFNSAWS